MDLKQPGTYLLILKIEKPLFDLKIGRKLRLDFKQGYYGYVGSALGGGGLNSRLKRHASKNKRTHWHIDYLLAEARLLGAVVKADNNHLECKWSAWLCRTAVESVSDFGASDCNCRSHLFYLGDQNALNQFIVQSEAQFAGQFVDVNRLRN